MVLIALAALYAIVFGNINIVRGLTLHSKFARYYGLSLIAIAIPFVWFRASIIDPALRPTIGTGTALSIAIDFLLWVLFVVLAALPFRIWQGKKVDQHSHKWKAIKVPVYLVLVLGIIASLFFYGVVYGLSTLGRSSTISISSQTEGAQFGKNKNVVDCLEHFISVAPDQPDLDLMIQSTSFLKACVGAANDKNEWCSLHAMREYPPQRETTPYCSSKGDDVFHCSLAVMGAQQACGRERAFSN